ncbi:MAG: hypothetical protein Q7T03_05640 [Deltaproteobacteria bacterium]|nr:hypothetical protein [Deltaproteobacteria bacterium]
MKILLTIILLFFTLPQFSFAGTVCPPKPPPPIGYSSSDAQCIVKNGKAEWKWIKRFSYRCGIKPPPPPGMSSDQAACECREKTCRWIWFHSSGVDGL